MVEKNVPDSVGDYSELQQPWEIQIAELLSDLLTIQEEALAVLSEKRRLLVAADHTGLEAIQHRENEIISNLQTCLLRREALLDQARTAGISAVNLTGLTAQIQGDKDSRVQSTLRKARHHAKLLQHESLTNWVVVQKTLIHLSQMLEIIATGGRLQPTYGNGEPRGSHGSLLDQAV